MKKSRITMIIILVIIILASLATGLAFVLSKKGTKQIKTEQTSSNTSNNSSQDTAQGISLDEVAKHTGKNGNSCWVAVDGTVYEISGFVLWVEGEHKPPGGRAKCGKDLSEVIKQSPHGKSKLKLLKEIGPLQQ